MGVLRELARGARRLLRKVYDAGLPVWYSPEYRLPLPSLESRAGLEPRRADFVSWYLQAQDLLSPAQLKTPPRISYAALSRAHTTAYLESLSSPEVVAAIFGVTPDEAPLEGLLHMVRIACGGTLEAARAAMARRGPAMNLLGGFHHAAPDHGAGFCAVNDIAVAVAALRAEGFRGKVLILDLDAHPPDGTARCFRDDADVHIASLSGSDFGPLPGRVDEVFLPAGTGDARYLHELAGLMERCPRASLAFVIAGGDVLAGDHLGHLGLTLAGARERDLRVLEWVGETPSVWLPGGGYSSNAWRVLAGTGMALIERTRRPISLRADPLRDRYDSISASLDPSVLGDLELTEDDFGFSRPMTPKRRLLGFYTPEGGEYALYRYGVIEHIERLGYEQPRVLIDATPQGDRWRLLARADGEEHTLIECVLEKRAIREREFLFIHWLTLRHPRGGFNDKHPKLPGQEVPGLGLAREVGEILRLMAKRLELAGVAFCPAWYHTAYASRRNFRFLDPEAQGRFLALLRDLGKLPLREASRAIAEGRVRRNGEPYAWEPLEMVFGLDELHDQAEIEAARDRTIFSVTDEAPPPGDQSAPRQ